MAGTFFEDHFFSGWGIRTLSAFEVRYNPMSYHNGSVWPHDNSLIGKGLAQYGFGRQAARLLTSLYEASSQMDLCRTPELFCGFHKRGEDGGPTLYPVACSPQAWSAGSAYLLLEACIGIAINAAQRQVRFLHPCLPSDLDWIRVNNIPISDSSIDLEIHRHQESAHIEVTQRRGSIEVVKSF